MAIVVMAAVALVVPGLVGPTVSGEREHRTLDLLLVTPLSPARIVAGKLVASMAFVLLLVVACLPLFMVTFVLGQVALPQILEVLGFTVMVALSVGALSMMASVALRGVVPATVVSYLAMLVLTVGPLLGGYALQGPAVAGAASDVAAPYSGTGASDLVAAVSPVAGADDLLGGTACNGGTNPPGSSLGTALVSLVDNCGPSADLTTDVGPLGTWQTWEVSLACNGAIAVLALAGSALVLRRREVT
jgi:ABC-type transport system involved in multi-copper enzyme maturation permease subunit